MKIIHAADIHLGSKMDSSFTNEKAKDLKSTILSTFVRMIEYAHEENVKIIILAGDIFDSNYPSQKDKRFFYEIVKRNADIDFLYLKGNHDINSIYDEKELDNLKYFSNEWTTYDYDNISISGIELSEENSLTRYSSLSLDKNRINIVVMHGQVANGFQKDVINISKLKDKNIDYLALGHVHKYQSGKIDNRGKYAYSGCLQGRGFDEIGEHGFILLQIDDKIQEKFIPFTKNIINEFEIDISNTQSIMDVYNLIIQSVDINADGIYRINLIGQKSFDDDNLENDIKNILSYRCYFVDIKDKTSRKIDIDKYLYDSSLKGEFVKMVYNDSNLSDEEKNKIINLGIRALEDKEIDL